MPRRRTAARTDRDGRRRRNAARGPGRVDLQRGPRRHRHRRPRARADQEVSRRGPDRASRDRDRRSREYRPVASTRDRDPRAGEAIALSTPVRLHWSRCPCVRRWSLTGDHAGPPLCRCFHDRPARSLPPAGRRVRRPSAPGPRAGRRRRAPRAWRPGARPWASCRGRARRPTSGSASVRPTATPGPRPRRPRQPRTTRAPAPLEGRRARRVAVRAHALASLPNGAAWAALRV